MDLRAYISLKEKSDKKKWLARELSEMIDRELNLDRYWDDVDDGPLAKRDR